MSSSNRPPVLDSLEQSRHFIFKLLFRPFVQWIQSIIQKLEDVLEVLGGGGVEDLWRYGLLETRLHQELDEVANGHILPLLITQVSRILEDS